MSKIIISLDNGKECYLNETIDVFIANRLNEDGTFKEKNLKIFNPEKNEKTLVFTDHITAVLGEE